MSRRRSRRPQHNKSGTAQPESWLLNALGGAPSATGLSINSTTAMRVSAVFAAVNLIAQDVAKLPLLVKEINPEDYSTSPRYDHPLYRLLHVRPNRWQTRFEFRELETVCLLLHGNSYTYKRYNSQGQIVELIPIHPARVTLMESPDGGLLYQVSRSGYHDNAVLEGAGTLIPAEYIGHIRGLSLDGLSGVSVLTYAREALGLALATEAHSAKLFGNGARPGGVLKVPQVLSDQAYDRLRSSWQAAHGGLDNAWRTAILEAGTEWQPMSMTAEDLQFIESRKFQVEDIARFFRVPPHKLQDLSRATFSNIEHLSMEFVSDTLGPWLARKEAAYERDLLSDAEQGRFAIQHDVHHLLRGDSAARASFYTNGRQWGYLSANDCRRLEGMKPLAQGGDDYLQPMNMIPTHLVGTQPDGHNDETT